ncbi:hypothetical protein Riv7116_6320 [Rivularia sp. PCC 7116]|nr:hypothetical protein Riv7116_6320 [Rivularia sp. PCC 7116]
MFSNTIKIRSLEANLGENHILGAFSDSHNCYYWKEIVKPTNTKLIKLLI